VGVPRIINDFVVPLHRFAFVSRPVDDQVIRAGLAVSRECLFRRCEISQPLVALLSHCMLTGWPLFEAIQPEDSAKTSPAAKPTAPCVIRAFLLENWPCFVWLGLFIHDGPEELI